MFGFGSERGKRLIQYIMISNPFLNKKELRMRALWRILIFIVFFFFLLSLGGLIENGLLQYAYRIGITLLLLFLQFRYLDRRSFDDAGLKVDARWFKDLGWGILIGFAAVSFIFLIEWASGMLRITEFEWERLNADYLWILVFLFQMMVVGYYEEAAFRGVIMKNMAEGFQPEQESGTKIALLLAVFLSSALFGLGHFNNPNASWISTTYIVFAGIMLAVPYVLTGSLAVPVGIHAAWNFSLGGIYGFKVSGLAIQHSIIHIRQVEGFEVWTGGSFGPEAGLLGILGMLLIIGLCVWHARQTQGGIRIDKSFDISYPERSQKVSGS
jgi:hypothetical protein